MSMHKHAYLVSVLGYLVACHVLSSVLYISVVVYSMFINSLALLIIFCEGLKNTTDCDKQQ